MFVRQVKRKCSVRGCKSTDCFAISRTREVGNTVIICKSCLGKALGAIDEIDPKTKSNIPAVDNTAVPSLFFNAKALGKTEAKDGLTADVVIVDENPTVTGEQTEPETKIDDVPSADDTTDADIEGTNPPEDVTEFKCPNCGKTFDSEKGLKTHLRYCNQQSDNE